MKTNLNEEEHIDFWNNVEVWAKTHSIDVDGHKVRNASYDSVLRMIHKYEKFDGERGKNVFLTVMPFAEKARMDKLQVRWEHCMNFMMANRSDLSKYIIAKRELAIYDKYKEEGKSREYRVLELEKEVRAEKLRLYKLKTEK